MSEDSKPSVDWLKDFDPSLLELDQQMETQVASVQALSNYDLDATILRQRHARAYIKASPKSNIDGAANNVRKEQPLIEQNAVLGAFRAQPELYRGAYEALGWNIDDLIADPENQPAVFNPLQAVGDRSFTHTDVASKMMYYYEIENGGIVCTKFNPRTDTQEHEEVEWELSHEEIEQLAFIAGAAQKAVRQAYEAIIERLEMGEL